MESSGYNPHPQQCTQKVLKKTTKKRKTGQRELTKKQKHQALASPILGFVLLDL